MDLELKSKFAIVGGASKVWAARAPSARRRRAKVFWHRTARRLSAPQESKDRRGTVRYRPTSNARPAGVGRLRRQPYGV